MKTKVWILTTLIWTTNFCFAQQDNECMINLSMFTEYAKAKNYDAAYDSWMKVRNMCPKINKAIYVYGEKILNHKAEKAPQAEKIAFLKDHLLLIEQRIEHFPNKTKVGESLADKAQIMYDNRALLGYSDEELYQAFDKAFETDEETFKNPKSLYTYFSLMVDLYDAKKRTAQNLFNKYDDVNEKIVREVKNFTQSLNKMITKESNGIELSKKDLKYKKYYESFLSAYDKVSTSMDSKLGSRANCENLIPLYSKGFDTYKTDIVWLQRAVKRMADKECTEDPLFFKLVHAYHNTNPSADTAYYLGILKDKQRHTNEAIKYFKQAISLEKDPFEKANILYKVASKFKGKKSYQSARTYYMKALAANPSMGKCYLAIAQMYAASANDCGEDNFSKRSVYWLAADLSRKAGKVDSNLRSVAKEQAEHFESKAPAKSEIFAKSNSGETINFKCWVGGSVVVPQIGGMNQNTSLKRLLMVAIPMATILFSCQNNFKKIQQIGNASNLPIAVAEHINLKYTDSGKLKANLLSKKMLDYSNMDFSYKEFPEGITLYLYDNDNSQTKVVSDYAIVFDLTGLIDLRDNVAITSEKQKSLFAEQLYYDQTSQWLFTNKPVVFKDSIQTINGKGFDSNVNFTKARVTEISGTVYIHN